MKLSVDGDRFVVNGAPTYTLLSGFPDADPRIAGLLLNHRVVNGVFDDLNEDHDYDGDGRDDWAYAETGSWDPDVNTSRFVQAMRAWREYGVIAFTIGLQGGNPFATSPPPAGMSTAEIDCGAFEPDGTLRPAFMSRLKCVLDQAKALDMVPIVNYFYQGGNRRIHEEALPGAVDSATNWILEQGYDGLIIDLANECDARAYWPSLQLANIHRLILRVKDAVDIHVNRTHQEKSVLVSASFTGSFSTAERICEIPISFLRAVDLLLPHGNKRTSEEIRGAITALRERATEDVGRQLPIVYNEDIQGTQDDIREDKGGDLEHLEACIDAGVSWGDLIRSHQRVPCENWVNGTAVQREWLRTTHELAGTPRPPSSVRRISHKMRYRMPTSKWR